MSSTKMTREMRDALSARLKALELRISGLERAAEADATIDHFTLSLELIRERDEIADALADATLIETTPFDTQAIEIGDAVTIRSRLGVVERYVLVDAHFGARVQEDWVSTSSPLGQALVGQAVGDEVEVATPSGVSIYLILGFERSGGSSGNVGGSSLLGPGNPAA